MSPSSLCRCRVFSSRTNRRRPTAVADGLYWFTSRLTILWVVRCMRQRPGTDLNGQGKILWIICVPFFLVPSHNCKVIRLVAHDRCKSTVEGWLFLYVLVAFKSLFFILQCLKTRTVPWELREVFPSPLASKQQVIIWCLAYIEDRPAS